MAKYRLLGKRLLVQEITRRQTVQNGIHLPDYTHNDRPREFRVLAVGTKPVEAKVGDRVLCHSHFTGPEAVGRGRFIITEDQILAIFPHSAETKEPNV